MEPTYADFYRQSRWQRVKGWLRKHWKVCGGGALGGIALIYVNAVFNEVAPARKFAQGLACQAREWWSDPAPGTHFTILISNLAGDTDGRQTGLVRDVFVGQRGVDVRRTCHVVELTAAGGSLADAEAEALRAGQARLDDWNADLLIWGEVKKADQELSLWFTSREGGSTLGSPSYSLTEKLTLPENFQADLGTQLEAVALAQIAPATEQAGTFLVDILKPVRDRLEQLVTAPPPGVNAEQMASLWFSLALATQTIGEQSGEREPLDRAVEAYRDVLTVWTRERVPHDWAMTQNNLGNALRMLGEREEDITSLQEATAAYRAALEVWTRERTPREWAMTQENLGLALRTLGQRENATERLEQSIVAFSAALEIRTRDQGPLRWAAIQSSVSTSFRALGEREVGTKNLSKAVDAARAALEVYTQEQAPLDWAMTQHNLGTALRVLGEREEGTQLLEEAVTALRAALDVRKREHLPLEWAKTQNNLGNALSALGEREDGTARLDEAVAAYRAALEVLEPAGAEYYVGIAEGNLVRTEALLAKRRASNSAE